MFTVEFTKSISSNEEDLILFENPSTSTKVVRFEVCDIEYAITANSTWKLYLNPTVTSNGTTLTATSTNTSTPDASVYSVPTISDDGTHLRTFGINKDFDYLPIMFAIIHLHPDNKILLKKTSSEKGTATISLSWREFE